MQRAKMDFQGLPVALQPNYNGWAEAYPTELFLRLRCYHTMQERVPKRWILSCHCLILKNPFTI